MELHTYYSYGQLKEISIPSMISSELSDRFRSFYPSGIGSKDRFHALIDGLTPERWQLLKADLSGPTGVISIIWARIKNAFMTTKMKLEAEKGRLLTFVSLTGIQFMHQHEKSSAQDLRTHGLFEKYRLSKKKLQCIENLFSHLSIKYLKNGELEKILQSSAPGLKRLIEKADGRESEDSHSQWVRSRHIDPQNQIASVEISQVVNEKSVEKRANNSLLNDSFAHEEVKERLAPSPPSFSFRKPHVFGTSKGILRVDRSERSEYFNNILKTIEALQNPELNESNLDFYKRQHDSLDLSKRYRKEPKSQGILQFDAQFNTLQGALKEVIA